MLYISYFITHDKYKGKGINHYHLSIIKLFEYFTNKPFFLLLIEKHLILYIHILIYGNLVK